MRANPTGQFLREECVLPEECLDPFRLPTVPEDAAQGLFGVSDDGFGK